MRNRQFVFAPKIEYKLVADLPAGKAGRSEAASSGLPFPKVAPRKESNLHQRLRRALLYPLSYEGGLIYLP